MPCDAPIRSSLLRIRIVRVFTWLHNACHILYSWQREIDLRRRCKFKKRSLTFIFHTKLNAVEPRWMWKRVINDQVNSVETTTEPTESVYGQMSSTNLHICACGEYFVPLAAALTSTTMSYLWRESISLARMRRRIYSLHGCTFYLA